MEGGSDDVIINDVMIEWEVQMHQTCWSKHMNGGEAESITPTMSCLQTLDRKKAGLYSWAWIELSSPLAIQLC